MVWQVLSLLLLAAGLLAAPISAASNSVCRALQALPEINASSVYCDMDIFAMEVGWDFGNRQCDVLAGVMLVVVRPENSDEVAAVVAYVHSQPGLILSVRSGGHSYTCNSVIEGSVHLDLRTLNRVKVVENDIDISLHDAEGSLLRFGSGNTFRDLFDIVDLSRFTFIFGGCHTVGVGVFFLHGGLHPLSKIYGWGNETIRSMEVVIANGTKLQFRESRQRLIAETTALSAQTARATNSSSSNVDWPARYDRDPVQVYSAEGELINHSDFYHDLWDAMRVAGSSFGIVTELTIQLYSKPTPFIWQFFVDLTEEEELKMYLDASLDDTVVLAVGRLYEGNTLIISLSEETTTDPEESFNQNLAWLDNWFLQNGIWDWKLTRYGETLSNTARLVFNGRPDFSLATPHGADGFSSSNVLISYSSPDRDNLISWFQQRTTANASDCYLLFQYSALDGEPLVGIEYACGPASAYKDEMGQIEREVQAMFPNTTRYANIPIDMGSEEENRQIITRYYPGHEKLIAAKSKYDPDHVFVPFQGISTDEYYWSDKTSTGSVVTPSAFLVLTLVTISLVRL